MTFAMMQNCYSSSHREWRVRENVRQCVLNLRCSAKKMGLQYQFTIKSENIYLAYDLDIGTLLVKPGGR